jgi:hypothetical protein
LGLGWVEGLVVVVGWGGVIGGGLLARFLDLSCGGLHVLFLIVAVMGVVIGFLSDGILDGSFCILYFFM